MHVLISPDSGEYIATLLTTSFSKGIDRCHKHYLKLT